MAFPQIIRSWMQTVIGSLVSCSNTPGLCCKRWLSIIDGSCPALAVKQTVLKREHKRDDCNNLHDNVLVILE